MQKSLLLLLAILSIAFLSPAQNLPQMVYVPGGTTVLGGGYQYEVRDYAIYYLGQDSWYDSLNTGRVVIGEIPHPNNPTRRVTIASFQLAQTEVTNAQYRDFLIDSLLQEPARGEMHTKVKKSKKLSTEDQYALWRDLFAAAGEAGLLPDTACWTKDFPFSYNDPLATNYFRHAAFDQYPVVGVSWDQANAYCAWLSRANNAERARRKLPPQPNFRLPTEMEWEYAALGVNAGTPEDDVSRRIYPWKGNRITDDKGQFAANIKTGHGDYIGDKYMSTSPVTAFPPNDFGLYAMAGNVSEWVEDVFRINEAHHEWVEVNYGGIDPQSNPRVVKGGSWADYYVASMCGSRTAAEQKSGTSRVGFRVAQTVQSQAFGK